MEIENREEEHLEKQKNEEDEKNTYNKQFEWCNLFFAWLKNDWKESYLYKYHCRYSMDSIHTKKTYQKENKEQFKDMTDEQI